MSNWNDPNNPPDADMEVLVRIESGGYPIAIASAVFDEDWRFMPMGGKIPRKVIGWMHIHDAATILDGLEV